MAKVLFGNGIADMRRSQAGSTFARNKGGSYVRQRVRPTNPQTVNQIRLREALSTLSKAWGSELTQAQRDSWTIFAELNTVIDVLGQALTLSGIQMYIKLNTRLLQSGQPRINDPPLDLAVTQLTLLTATFVVATPIYNVTFEPALQAGEGLQIFSTPPLSPGISFIKNRKRQISLFLAGPTSPVDVHDDWIAKNGVEPQLGAKIATEARILNGANGAISVPLRFDLIVT